MIHTSLIHCMKRTLPSRLLPTPELVQPLRPRCALSLRGQTSLPARGSPGGKKANSILLQKLFYAEVRTRFRLPRAQNRGALHFSSVPRIQAHHTATALI
ncbi:hypothetical protein MPNT_50129 [Candidatus Methylacidithermus pantelleriae]|uniref:Uncharacterized protein n=1 Tax=Candidatus Methylacidithermus pantelleriae TaxID=2744239 RepID=A0A8J2FX29_9BACT|nr:hypothetical protein MPNT_50129 [Candidatus Methylacidithermus pantelleriae]